jgi:site-specific recombinase XerD
MKLFLIYRPTVLASASPYRLLDEHSQEIAWANAFLDAQRIRQLSLRSLRAYAFDLLHFARWWSQRPLPLPLSEIDDTCLLDYVRSQLDLQPPPAPATVNRRLTVIRCLYRFHYGREISPGQTHLQRTYTQRPPLGYGRPRRVVVRGLRLKQPRRVIVPLSADQVARFWRSFRTFRDLAMVGLMLLDGLRSCEVLALQLADLHDLQLAEPQMRVLGKGNKARCLPLPHEICDVLEKYLHLERPPTNSSSLFVCLKGRHRGLPLTPAGVYARYFVTTAAPPRFQKPIPIGLDIPLERIWCAPASPCPPSSTSWGMPRSTPPCSTSNSHPRTSGANTAAPSKNGPPWTPRNADASHHL